MNRHLTEDQISRALAGQSTFEEQQHANGCPACCTEIARSLHDLTLLRQGIHAYAERELQRATPVVRHRSAVRHLTPAWAVAAASVAVMAAVLVWQARSDHAVGSSSRNGSTRDVAFGHAGTADEVDAGNEFYPLAYSTIPVTNGHIVRIEVPRSAPVAFGLDPINFVSARRGAILADVVVGEDGLARAVRFVRPATDDVRKE
jgi:hypothetical protein